MNFAQWQETFETAKKKAWEAFLGRNRNCCAMVQHDWMNEQVRRVRECLLLPGRNESDFHAIPVDGGEFLAFNSRDPSLSAKVKTISKRSGVAVSLREAQNCNFDTADIAFEGKNAGILYLK